MLGWQGRTSTNCLYILSQTRVENVYSEIALVSRSRTTHTNAKDAATVTRRQPYAHSLPRFSFSFMPLHLLYSIAVAGHPPRSPLLYKHRTSRQGSTHVYKIVLLLVEDNREVFPSLLSLLCSPGCFPLLSATEQLSARSRPISRAVIYISVYSTVNRILSSSLAVSKKAKAKLERQLSNEKTVCHEKSHKWTVGPPSSR